MKFTVLIKDTVPLSQFLPSSLRAAHTHYVLLSWSLHSSTLCAVAPVPLLHQSALPITYQSSQKEGAMLLRPGSPPASGAFAHFLLPWSPLSPVAQPRPHSPPWTTSVSLRTQAIRRLRGCVASTAGEPISSASGFGSFLDLEPLSVCQLHTSS